MPKQSEKSRGHAKRMMSTVPQPCGKQWQSRGSAQCAVQQQQEELPEAQRAARGAARGGDGPRAAGARRAAASVCAARKQQRRCNGEEQERNAAHHDETHQTRRTPETARAPTAGRGGHGPPMVSRQLCLQQHPQSTAPCASRTRPCARSPLWRPSASLPLASSLEKKATPSRKWTS